MRKIIKSKDRIVSDSSSGVDSDSDSSDSDSSEGSSDGDGTESDSSGSGSDSSDSDSEASSDDDVVVPSTAQHKKVKAVTSLTSVRRTEKVSPSHALERAATPEHDFMSDCTDTLILMPQDSNMAESHRQDSNLVGFPQQGQGRQVSSHHEVGSPSSMNDATSDSAILAQMFESFPVSNSDGHVSGAGAGAGASKFSFPNSTMSPAENSLPSAALSGLKLSSGLGSTKTSVPKEILKPALSSGLQVTFRVRHGVSPTQIPGSTSAYVQLRNCNTEGFLR
jgi:hypothetical protein